MFLRRTLLLSVLLLLCSGISHAGGAITPHVAEYKVKISVLGGKLRTRVEATDTGFYAQSSIDATGMSRIVASGSIRESSLMSVSEEGLRPERFRSSDTLSKGGQEVDLSFDWNALTIGGQIDRTDFQTGINGDVHDRVSLQYGLMFDLMAGVEREEYALQDSERLKLLSITNIGTRSVKVPFGSFEAVGIQHQATNSSRVTTLWCVEELGYLPVIIEQHRKGKRRMRAMLTSYTPL